MVGFLLKLRVKNIVCQTIQMWTHCLPVVWRRPASSVSKTPQQNVNEGWTKAWQLPVNKLAQWGNNGVRAALALRMYQFTRSNKAFSSTVEDPDVVLATCLKRAVWDFLDVKGPSTLQPEDLCNDNTCPGYTFSPQGFLCSHKGCTEKFLV